METEEELYWPEPPMTVGIDCCPHYVPYGSECDECDQDDVDEAMGLTVTYPSCPQPEGVKCLWPDCQSIGCVPNV